MCSNSKLSDNTFCMRLVFFNVQVELHWILIVIYFFIIILLILSCKYKKSFWGHVACVYTPLGWIIDASFLWAVELETSVASKQHVLHTDRPGAFSLRIFGSKDQRSPTHNGFCKWKDRRLFFWRKKKVALVFFVPFYCLPRVPLLSLSLWSPYFSWLSFTWKTCCFFLTPTSLFLLHSSEMKKIETACGVYM